MYQVKIIVVGKGLPKVIFWQPFYTWHLLLYKPTENKMGKNNIADEYLKGLKERLSEDDKLSLSYAFGATDEQLANLKNRYPACPDSLLQLLTRINGTYWQKYGRILLSPGDSYFWGDDNYLLPGDSYFLGSILTFSRVIVTFLRMIITFPGS